MNNTAEILFEYLRDVIYSPHKAKLDLSQLDESFVKLGQGLVFLAQCFEECNEFAKSLSKGNLDTTTPPPQNMLAGPLKSLHASLRHLTWQSQQVAKGDYGQHVDFMGEFANAFNTMIAQLSEREQKLEFEVEQSEQNARSLELANQLLTNITQYIDQQIFVVDADDCEILMSNASADAEIAADAAYLKKVLDLLAQLPANDDRTRTEHYTVEITLEHGADNDADVRYLIVNCHVLSVKDRRVKALIISDISQEKIRLKLLEDHAYHDPLTGVFNRYQGMSTLERWVADKVSFSLAFFDLDNLKYINDIFGHSEGDTFIINVSRAFDFMPTDSIISRVGGDEFMLLIPGVGYDAAKEHVQRFLQKIGNHPYLSGKKYTYAASYGIVAVDAQNDMSAGEILEIADERMYENKRENKRGRKHT